jgi:hypothetical protein
MASSEAFVAKGIAAGRLVYGLGCMLAPRQMMGPAGARAEGQMIWLARAFGVRDFVLGGATLKALADGDDAAIRWVEVGAAADSLDIANAAVFRKELDKLGISATLGLAVPAAIGGWYAARKLRAA